MHRVNNKGSSTLLHGFAVNAAVVGGFSRAKSASVAAWFGDVLQSPPTAYVEKRRRETRN
jgi:hypothetical protein